MCVHNNFTGIDNVTFEMLSVSRMGLDTDGDRWREVQLSNSTKLLPIPSGHTQRTTEGPMTAIFDLLRLFSLAVSRKKAGP